MIGLFECHGGIQGQHHWPTRRVRVLPSGSAALHCSLTTHCLCSTFEVKIQKHGSSEAINPQYVGSQSPRKFHPRPKSEQICRVQAIRLSASGIDSQLNTTTVSLATLYYYSRSML